MDPLAHTFVGAALAQAGLAKKTRFGAGALIIGANLPDIDVLSYLWGSDAGLYFRRGWTHGVPAVAVFPFILTGILLLYGRLRTSAKPPPQARAVLFLSFVGIATHPALDALNTYGMRWLMPLDGRWFYGDSVFIVDPWIWLVLGGAVFLAHSRTRTAQVAWLLLAGSASWLILSAVPDAIPAKLTWMVGLGLFVFLKLSRRPRNDTGRHRLAAAALLLTAVYIGLMVGSSRYARRAVADELAEQGIPVVDLMVGPVPVDPFVRDVVVETPSGYRYGSLRILDRFETDLEPRVIPKPSASPALDEVLRSPEIRGFMNWARFPFVELERTGSGCVVYIMDARYTRARTGGFGVAKVSADDACSSLPR